MKFPILFQSYLWLVHTIYKRGKINFKEINELWLKHPLSGGVEMHRNTFFRHRQAIEDMFDIIVDCDYHDDYQYYIENPEVLRENLVYPKMVSKFLCEKDQQGPILFSFPLNTCASNSCKIIVKVDALAKASLLANPWHISQREVLASYLTTRESTTCEGSWFEFTLQPTDVFIQKILSFGPHVEVISPVSLRKLIARMATQTALQYTSSSLNF